MIALASKFHEHSLTVKHDTVEEARTIIRFEQEFWPDANGSRCFAIPTDWWNSWSNYTGLKVLDRQTANVKVSSELPSSESLISLDDQADHASALVNANTHPFKIGV